MIKYNGKENCSLYLSLSGPMSDQMTYPRLGAMGSAECRIKHFDCILQFAKSIQNRIRWIYSANHRMKDSHVNSQHCRRIHSAFS